MYEPTLDDAWLQGVDLAQVPDFQLGRLQVRPATCEVECDGHRQGLQRRVMQVLVALDQAQGQVVSQDELVQRCWRGLSVSDDAIFRCIGRLRKLAAECAGPPFSIETIPGVGYRLTSNDGRGAATPPRLRQGRAGRWGMVLALAAILILAGMFLFNRQDGSASDHVQRVTVQPFEALGTSGEAKALARRIPNEVVDQLGDSQVDSILATRATSQPPSRDTAAGLRLTGMVRDDADDVVVEVRLEDAASSTALWSAEFKRDRGSTTDVPLEVAARVADVVNMANFARSADPPLTDAAALSALLQTSEMIRDSASATWAQKIESARGVVDRHPGFAFGHSILASAYMDAANDIDDPQRARAMRELARAQAQRTLKLDPEDAGAYAVLSELVGPTDYLAREKILQQGLRIAKHPKEPLGALYSYQGTMLSSVGRLREALSSQLIAQATDKWGAPKMVKLALTYASLGDFDEARRWLGRAVQLWPHHPSVRAARLSFAGFYEQPSDARATIDAMATSESIEASSEFTMWRSFVEARAETGGRLSARTADKVRAAMSSGTLTSEAGVTMLAALGQTSQAIAAANQALDRRPLDPRFLFTPAMQPVRRDPGFVALATRMGLVQYWRRTGKRPDFCSEGRVTTDCSKPLLSAIGA